MLRSKLVYLLLVSVFGLTLVFTRVARSFRSRPVRNRRRIVVTGTFHNRGWFLAHARPLACSGVDEVIFIVDEPQPDPPLGIRFICPPRWARIIMGRALSKLIWMCLVGWCQRPAVYMGYHILPGALTALIAARLLGGQAIYQMTGGPIEISGGGYDNENRLMSSLRRPSALIERMACAVVRQFDLVVVRGRKARHFLHCQGIRLISIIPGGIDDEWAEPAAQRDIDTLFVGRMTPIKQPLQFIRVVADLRRSYPKLRAAMVGGGPMLGEVRSYSMQREVGDAIEIYNRMDDVREIVRRSKVFVLTSRSEGLSIAMLEAMGAGAVPVVADVGELGDVIIDGVNGYLVPPDRPEQYADRVFMLLADPVLLSRMSQAASETVKNTYSIDAVAERWRTQLRKVLSMPNVEPGYVD